MTVRTIKLSTLKFDWNLYPRKSVDSVNEHQIFTAMEAGVEIPPIVVDRESHRIVDGFHRTRAALRLDPDGTIRADLRSYPDDTALFLDAVALNATHGAPLRPYDRAHIIDLAETFGITNDQIAQVLHVPIVTIEQIRDSRTAYKKNGGSPKRTRRVVLKRTLRHLAGQELTPAQVEANEKASGWSPAFHARQLVMLIEADAVDWTDETTRDSIENLGRVLSERVPV